MPRAQRVSRVDPVYKYIKHSTLTQRELGLLCGLSRVATRVVRCPLCSRSFISNVLGCARLWPERVPFFIALESRNSYHLYPIANRHNSLITLERKQTVVNLLTHSSCNPGSRSKENEASFLLQCEKLLLPPEAIAANCFIAKIDLEVRAGRILYWCEDANTSPESPKVHSQIAPHYEVILSLCVYCCYNLSFFNGG